MVTKLVTKLVTKEPCSIFSVRLYAPTVSQTVGNTRVTEGFGGDEGDRTFLSKNSFATPPNKSNTGRGLYRL